jgi:hypothetical protein
MPKTHWQRQEVLLPVLGKMVCRMLEMVCRWLGSGLRHEATLASSWHGGHEVVLRRLHCVQHSLLNI